MIPGVNFKHVVIIVAATAFLAGVVVGFVLGSL